MASTSDLRVSNLFSLKDHVCLVTGGGEATTKLHVVARSKAID